MAGSNLCVAGGTVLRPAVSRLWSASRSSGAQVTPGVREMACRENQGATSFDKAAENLARLAQIVMCGEQLRLWGAEGRRVQQRNKQQRWQRPGPPSIVE